MNARHPLTLMLAMLAAASAASAAAVTVTDCAASPVAKVGKKTVVDRPADDVVFQCALLPLGGTTRVEVTARSVTVDGRNGGSIVSAGKGPAIELFALGTGPDGRSVHIDGSNVTAANPNGDVTIDAAGAVEIRDSGLQAGGDLRITCNGAGCPITLDDVTTGADDLIVAAQGTVTVRSSTLATSSPLDRIDVSSATGDVVMADDATVRRAAGFVCRDDVLARCPGPQCPLPVSIDSIDAAIAFCECEEEPGTAIETGIEGNLRIAAPLGDIDLRGVTARVGENIDLVALGDVDMTAASISNCGPKTGRFQVASATCRIADATLLDDEDDAQPGLGCSASGTPVELGTCSARR